MTGYQGSEDPADAGRHARPPGSGEVSGLPSSTAWASGAETVFAAVSGPSPGYEETTVALSRPYGAAGGTAAVSADSVLGKNGPGVRKFGAAMIWLAVVSGFLLILAGVSVFGIVKLSSVQARLSHAQQQITGEKSELSSDEQELATLESKAASPPSDPLSAFGSMVCSNPDVYNRSTGQTITAYYPCSETDPG
jgi:hypothetical protein